MDRRTIRDKKPRFNRRHEGTRKRDFWASSAGAGERRDGGKDSNARLYVVGFFFYKNTHVPDLFCALYACSVAAAEG